MFGAMRKMGKIFSSNIIFVAFDAKEHDFMGSSSLWNLIEFGKLKNPINGQSITKDKIDLMVNIDQIGCTLSPIRKERKDYLIMLGTASLPKARRGLLNKCNKESGIDLDIALDYYGSANFTKIFYRLSDQRVFVDNKIPAVLFTSGITMNTNKAWDSPETINQEVLLKRTRLIYHWLSKIL
jgi:Zn-dependent M28 family amino/carboxypeptidase